LIVRAPAKLNLCLYLGPRRNDGLHELCSLTQALALADRLAVEDAEEDDVLCRGVEGPNIAARALEGLRDRGWAHPPVRVEIEKRIPVAAGLGGGSADAAAVLRLAADEVAGIDALAAELGADVPAQLEPGLALVRGAGERVERLPPPSQYGVVLIPSPDGLLTADVYAEADRLDLGRSGSDLDDRADRLRAAARAPLDHVEMLENDLQEAALSLRPEIREALDALEAAGAARALVTGSGPTAFGLFANVADADRAAASLARRYPNAVVTAPVTHR
jgi:4-diphosphocytidyl-2-C-methyl-D-erythritol kinase